MTISSVDWAIVAAYFLLSAAIGLYFTKRGGESLDQYFLSGRQAPWWLAGTAMVATTFAADTPLVVTGLVATKGVAGNWLWWNFVDERHAHRVLLRAPVAARGGHDGRRARRGPLRRQPGRPPPRLPRPLPRPPHQPDHPRLGHARHDQDPHHRPRPQGRLRPRDDGERRGGGGGDLLRHHRALRGGRGHVGGAVDGSRPVRGQDGRGDRARGVRGARGGRHRRDEIEADRPLRQRDGGPLRAAGERDPQGIMAYAWMPLLTLGVYLSVQWWAAWYPGAEPGGGGYVAQRIFSARTERDGVLATLFFQIAHYALRPWPWIVTGLATVILYPGLEDKGGGLRARLRGSAPHAVARLHARGLRRRLHEHGGHASQLGRLLSRQRLLQALPEQAREPEALRRRSPAPPPSSSFSSPSGSPPSSPAWKRRGSSSSPSARARGWC